MPESNLATPVLQIKDLDANLSLLKQQGVKLTVAFGGAAGTYLEQSCGSTEELVKIYQTIIKAYSPDVLDFDIENAMQTNNAQLDRMMQALVQIKQHI